MKNQLLVTTLIIFLMLIFVIIYAPTKEISIPTDKKSCEEKGGSWGPGGLSGGEMCVLKTSDGGRTCFDSRQCETKCIADDGGLPITLGKCRYDTNPFRCDREVRFFIAWTAICTD